MTRPQDGPWIKEWLSKPRFDVYLTAAGQDRVRALDLYEWNAAMSSAFQHDLGHLEVGLRNAYDAAWCMGLAVGAPHWVFDALTYFPVAMRRAADGHRYDANKTSRDNIRAAVHDATPRPRPGGPPPQPAAGKVIAELNFGFWRYLSSSAHDAHLWVPHLHKAFLPGTSRTDVDRPVERLHRLRNRVAHHESLIGQNLAGRLQDIGVLPGLISPELHDYIIASSTIDALINDRP